MIDGTEGRTDGQGIADDANSQADSGSERAPGTDSPATPAEPTPTPPTPAPDNGDGDEPTKAA